MTKAEAAEAARQQMQAAVTAMHCAGCPYEGCVGATASLDYAEQTARYRESCQPTRRSADAT